MADWLVFVVYLIGVGVGGTVAVYGFAVFLGAQPGGSPLGIAGLLIGIGTVAAGWSCIAGWSKKPEKPSKTPH